MLFVVKDFSNVATQKTYHEVLSCTVNMFSVNTSVSNHLDI